jgi:hypothetical protein
MKNKNLLIGLGLALVAYYFYNQNQKKKLQTTPYTDAELDKVVYDFVTEERRKALELNPSGKIEDIDKAKRSVLDLIQRAKTKGGDVSRANVDKILGILRKIQRNQMGDNSAGIATTEEQNSFYDFTKMPTTNVEPVKPPKTVGQSQIAPINVGSEERNMGDGLYIKYGKCDPIIHKCQIISVRQLAQGEGGGYVRTFTEKGMYFKEKGNVNVAPIVNQITEKEWNDLMQYVLMRTGF